jgi:hypothetical protein
MEEKTREEKTLEYLRDEFERLKHNSSKYQTKYDKGSQGYYFQEGTQNGLSFAIMEIEKILEDKQLKMAKLRLIIEEGNLDDISDKQINELREKLYNFICLRREMLGVTEYTNLTDN